MEKEQRHYELRSRSRSRSRTPKTQNLVSIDKEQLEHHYDLRNKSRSRSHTPGEVTSTRRSTSRSLATGVVKINEENIQVSNRKTTEIPLESPSTTLTKKVERRSERQRAKRQEASLNGQGESKDDNASDSQSELNRKSVTPQRFLTSDYSSEEGEREDPPSRPGSAYEIYKKAGDWWNKFPKTDYTYSQNSQCRYEIAPGILAMPNMSRRPIHTHDFNSTIDRTVSSKQTSVATNDSALGSSSNSLSFKDTTDQGVTSLSMSTKSTSPDLKIMHTEKSHSERYTSYKDVVYKEGRSLNLDHRKNWSSVSKYDSDTELDEEITTRSNKNLNKWILVRWSQKFYTFLIVWLFKVLELMKLRMSNKGEHYRSYHYYGCYNESRWSKLWKSIDRTLQYIYFFLAKILLLDCWLLSRLSNVRKRVGGKNQIIWITLIPLLLLAGAYFVQKHLYICLDSLRVIRYNITEISEFILPLYKSFAERVMQLKNDCLEYVPTSIDWRSIW